MKTNHFVSLVLIAGAVAIVWTVVKHSKDKKEVEGLKDKNLEGTELPGKPASSLVATENPVPGAQYFVSQPNALNYVEQKSQDAMNYIM